MISRKLQDVIDQVESIDSNQLDDLDKYLDENLDAGVEAALEKILTGIERSKRILEQKREKEEHANLMAAKEGWENYKNR